MYSYLHTHLAMSESRSQFGIQHNACKRDVRDKEIRRSSVASRGPVYFSDRDGPNRSLAFIIIYIGGHYSVARGGRKPQKTSESRTSRRLSSFRTLRCVHWMSTSALPALLPRTIDRDLGKRIVSFAACPVCGFLTYNLRSTAENNGQE